MSDHSKSPEAGANTATAARGVQAALFAAQTQAEANAQAAVAAVQAEVDARCAGRDEAEARQATDTAVFRATFPSYIFSRLLFPEHDVKLNALDLFASGEFHE